MTDALKAVVTVAVVAVAGAGGLFLAVVQPGGDGVVAAIRLPDGAEYMVYQKCNWNAEPYTVALYARESGGAWGWCYIDHEATRWRGVSMAYDAATDSVRVSEGGAVRAVIDRPARQLRLSGMGDRPLPQRAGVTPPVPFPL